MAGKSTGKLFLDVMKRWPEIRFVEANGKKLRYTALIVTDRGEIEIELLPKLAPNHVRSFVALAQAGYYDGLCFESREGDGATQNPVRAIAGGAPLGDGNDMGSVGYWLLPEILKPEEAAKRGVKHQPGTVGARRMEQPDTAGCRFYIALTEAPVWDGDFTIFGRVTRGLELAERIFQLPVREDQVGLLEFVTKPVIRRVTIAVAALEGP